MAANFCYSTDLTNLTLKLSKTQTPINAASMFTAGIVGNVLALFILIRHAKQHKWGIFYRLVAALASTDVFGIVTTGPVAFAVYNNNFKWVGGQPLCDYLSFMLIFSGVATLGIMTSMSLDRYLALWYPYFYNSLQKKRRIHVMLVGIWLFAAFIASLPLMKFGRNIRHFPCTWCLFDYFGTYPTDKAFSIMFALLGILSILSSSTFNCLVIFAVCKGASGGRRGSVKSTRGKERQRRSEIYILIFLFAILISHAICWIPLMIRILLNTSGATPTDRQADILAFRLAALNQILDPWLYILLRKEVLARVYRFYRKKRYGERLDSAKESTTGNSTEETSGSVRGNIRLQQLNPKDKKILKKMNSADSNITYVPTVSGK
ncbi:prostaglandin E2 receptor EP4 subtype-like [Saccostrea echinata]|uniref:prostaglandin E2 receptor EP4 subtype-like n=1 Tax=Saccostrea echinata TaxID=191078 RepID=UPI002A80871D|nr:prostaglandin E2 receptor EP4 subtype-like [Saccostrea echinata]